MKKAKAIHFSNDRKIDRDMFPIIDGLSEAEQRNKHDTIRRLVKNEGYRKWLRLSKGKLSAEAKKVSGK